MARRGLGRGLNALIPSIDKPAESESNAIVELSLDMIMPNRNQPRNKFDDDSLSELAESIKAVERKKYVQWVFYSTIDQSDWKIRQRITATYLTKYRSFLSPELRDMDPAWLVDHFQGLISNLVSTQSLLKQVSGADVS